MTILAFIFLTFAAAAVLLALNLYKSGLKPFHPPLIFFVLLVPASSFLAFNLYPLGPHSPQWMKWFVSFSFAATCCLIDLLSRFFDYHIADNIGKRIKWVDLTMLWRICGACASLGCYFVSGGAVGIFKNAEILIVTPPTVFVFYVHLFLQVYILHILEHIFRFANEHQRRIGRLLLLSLAAVTLFQVVFLLRSILYKTIVQPYVIAFIVTMGVCLPVMLLGLLRVRIGSYEVGISRRTIYSSISFLAFGAFCLAIGFASFIVRRFNLEFSFFEAFLLLFSAVFFTVLALLSENMRKRIRSFVNSHIFVRKFDYREQFFWLHQSYMAGEDVDESITILTAHLLYTLNYDKIQVFLINHGDGNFHLQLDPKTSSGKNIVIAGDDPIIKGFSRNKEPLEFAGKDMKPRESDILAGQRELMEAIGATAIFPISHQDTLLGILCVKHRKNERLDVEDKMLISIFTVSIGNVFFKYHMLKENIENKQFESFHHLAAFLVHDIKNQVATLSLLMKNADKNIHKPDFQKSLLISIQSCSNNLQKLVDKLSAPPKGGQLHAQMEDINAIVAETIASTGLSALQGMTVNSVLQASVRISVDRESLFYILKNLIVNALEAMNNKGTITIVTGDCNSFTGKLQKEFTLSEHFLRKYRVYIFLEDTGVGMSREFMERQLFRPFSTTKDKGIGVGLYQCKVLVEKMNGTLLCVSQLGAGAKFCILL